MVDPTQIELVILNLVINARDAMQNGGVVTIETTNCHRNAPTQPEEPVEGDYVMIKVIDVGIGMTAEVQTKAFEPFFTTKPPGAGSGLGLSQVIGTARQSGGDVQIESSPARGTSVSVYLPRAAVPAARPVAGPTDSTDEHTSRAVVLAVDDDDAVRTTTSDILIGLGYSVLQAPSGEVALELLGQREMIDVLLTDVVMTGMSGPELARRARLLRPDLPIVFISGYADPTGAIDNTPLRPLVRKPFRPSDLRRQIEAALTELRSPAI